MLISIAFGILISVVLIALPRYKIVIDPFLCIFASNAIIALQANLGASMPAWAAKERS
jgi:hypothetical protein